MTPLWPSILHEFSTQKKDDKVSTSWLWNLELNSTVHLAIVRDDYERQDFLSTRNDGRSINFLQLAVLFVTHGPGTSGSPGATLRSKHGHNATNSNI
jgi:hypothetical protein